MGLFGPGTSISVINVGPQGAAAHQAIKDLVGGIETELQDTPGEYLVLQAGGMFFASQSDVCKGAQPVQSMAESFDRAMQIMTAFWERPTTADLTLKRKADEVYSTLQKAAAKGIQPALLVGQLNDYLHYVDNDELTRKTQNVASPSSLQLGVADVHEAAYNNNTSRLATLISEGANIHATDVEGYTPLHYAAKAGSLDAVALLIRYRADVNALTSQGYTPLMLAAADNFHEVVKLLLSNKADATIRSAKGYTARQIAIARDHTETVHILEEAIDLAYRAISEMPYRDSDEDQ